VRIFVGFDDTDVLGADRGTGKLARWFEAELPPACTAWGVVRQQLLVDDRVPYTSHNSAACVVVEAAEGLVIPELITRAASHIARHFLSGSDPGLCVVAENHPAMDRLAAFGRRAAADLVTQDEARVASAGCHLSAHGGTGDGIIGAAAAVGLTAGGWYGRFIEYGGLRHLPEELTVADLESRGIMVTSLDRDAPVPRLEDRVEARGWLRPRLWGGRAILPVLGAGEGVWWAMGQKRRPVDQE
jgi:tRNA(Ile2) C34 agmatinyltransferase TiaS